jgi:glycosyltransferase involved in cell wall biosynthesis
MIKRRVVNLYSAALVGGERHVEYLVELGMPRERVFTGYDVVDNYYFRQKAEEVGRWKSEIRKQYQLPENYFLASARFIEKKNLPRLIRAYAEYRRLCTASVPDAESAQGPGNPPSPRLRRTGPPWDLILLGDGPLRETLSSQLSTLNLHDHVHLAGFKPYDELPVYYALAKAFVHASTTEQWGLVVNEAIASGLPVIVSNRCGCVPELVNGNGFTFDPFDEHELATRLLKMTALSDDERKQLAEAGYAIAANFAPDRFGEGLEQAATMAAKDARRTIGVMDRALLVASARFGT